MDSSLRPFRPGSLVTFVTKGVKKVGMIVGGPSKKYLVGPVYEILFDGQVLTLHRDAMTPCQDKAKNEAG